MIQMHPEKEAQRLQKAVLNMPINNPDNKRERFPKEIPRRLFPESPNLALREEIDQYIREYCAVDLPSITDEEIAAERRYKSYRSPTVADEEDEEPQPQTQPPEQPLQRAEEQEQQQPPPTEETEPKYNLERERQPYTASPGATKEHDDGFDLPRPAPNRPIGRRPRDDSMSSRPGYKPSLDPYYPRTGSQGPRPIPPHTRTGRSRSSSRGLHGSYDGRHSDGDLLTPGHSHGHGHGHGHSHHLRHGSSTGSGSGSGTPRHTPSEREHIPESVIEESRRYRDLERKEDKRLYDALRERDLREREKSTHAHYHGYPRPRTGEDEYRGAYGGPVGGNTSYDWYGYR